MKKNEIIKDERFCGEDWYNAPAFSPDGRTMYFSAARKRMMPYEYINLDYDLCSVSFDAKTGKFGDRIDTLFVASKRGKSVSFARPSYDGKYVLFSLCGYGMLSVYNKDADLWLYDVKKKTARPLDELNTKDSESFHNWSSDSRWIVFTSRRDDGFHAHLYFSAVGKDGRMGKPFMLPQKDPWEYYTNLTATYNVPEFIIKPVPVDKQRMVSKLHTKDRLQVKVRH